MNIFLARVLLFQRSKNPRSGSIPDALLAAEQQQTLSSAPAAKSFWRKLIQSTGLKSAVNLKLSIGSAEWREKFPILMMSSSK
jgi:hypothetical protein